MPITPAPTTSTTMTAAALAPWDAPAITVRLSDGRRVSPEYAGSIPLAHAMARATS
jgi:hypothetical protein